ncbi:MAG: hypothetical protein JWO77_3335 [Ilumatobacteraceae bacterium]|nr:hypothetical protein [Ilumatobacteraceae bacterium]
MKRLRACCVAVVLCSVAAAGCSHQASSTPSHPGPSTTEPKLCSRLVGLRTHLAEEGLRFEELLTATGRQANGILGAIVYLTPWDVSGGQRFRPALRFLALRGVAEASEGSEPAPELTPAVRRNAAALDRFLADGGCG